MSNAQDESRSTDIVVEIVQDLAWQLIDEQLDSESWEQLALLLEHSETARRAYLETIQMHVSLLDLFGRLPDAKEMLNKVFAEATKPAKKPPRRPGDVDVASQPVIGTTEPTGV